MPKQKLMVSMRHYYENVKSPDPEQITKSNELGDTLNMRNHRKPVLRKVVLAVLAIWGASAYAAGLGPVRVQSGLGQPLQASVPIYGSDADEVTTSCIKTSLEQPDGTVLHAAVRAAVERNGNAIRLLLRTRQPVNEPAVTLRLTVSCGTSIERSYQILLDPVLQLPQLPAAESPARAGTAVARQSMVAPAPDGEAAGTPSRRSSRRGQASPASAAATAAPASASAASGSASSRSKARAEARAEPRPATRSVLRMSGEDIDVYKNFDSTPALKLSDSLSPPRPAGDPQKDAEFQAAYSRFAAIMRGEDPAANSERQVAEMQAKLQELERQTEQIRTQADLRSQEDQKALATLKRDTVSSRWALGLGVLLLAAAIAIVWLYRRLQESARSRQPGRWDGAADSADGEGWGNTLMADDTLLSRGAVSPGTAPQRAAPSDWERGIPMDDTLAVDWASRQHTLQSPPVRKPPMPRPRDDEFDDAFGLGESDATLTAGMAPASRTHGHTHGQTSGQASVRTAGQMPTPPAAAAPGGARAGQAAGAHLLQVEEISDMMQEAEFWMLLNDPQRAIEILEPCAHVAHPVSPVPWIYLLDLYRVTAQKENYESLAPRLKKVFNANPPAWEQSSEALPRSLRDYPHVVQKIEEMWEGDEVIAYLENLLLDGREGDRAGFDLAVFREIIHLIGVARNPEVPRRGDELHFDAPQPRQISQKVTAPAARPAKAAPADTDAQNGFDRATAQQATGRQSVSKIGTVKHDATTAAARATVQAVAAQEATQSQPQPATEAVEPETAMPASAEQPSSRLQEPDEELAFESAAPAAAPENHALRADAASDAANDTDSQADADAERMADMARKLDLVMAYQEIGENVGARVLLEEVIQGGSALQVEKARAMLKKLLKEIDWQ